MKKTLKAYKKTKMVRGKKANKAMNKAKMLDKVVSDRMRQGKEYGPQMTKVPKV